jgi:hypothetical protein
MYDAFGESVSGESTKFPPTGISDTRIVVMVQIDSGKTVTRFEPGCIPPVPPLRSFRPRTWAQGIKQRNETMVAVLAHRESAPQMRTRRAPFQKEGTRQVRRAKACDDERATAAPSNPVI